MSSGDTEDTPRPPPRTPGPGRPKGGTGSGGGGLDDACSIVEDTIVNSPDRTVASTIRTGDVLDVVYDRGPPRVLRLRTTSGAVLGSLTCPSLPQLILCIEAGHAYAADVTSVHGGRIDVRVHPA